MIRKPTASDSMINNDFDRPTHFRKQSKSLNNVHMLKDDTFKTSSIKDKSLRNASFVPSWESSENADCNGIDELNNSYARHASIEESKLSHKINEIRQRASKVTQMLDDEMTLQKHRYSKFLEDCQKICDLTISSSDIDTLNLSELEHNEVQSEECLTDSSPSCSENYGIRRHIYVDNFLGYIKKLKKFVLNFPFIYMTVPVCVYIGMKLAASNIIRNLIL